MSRQHIIDAANRVALEGKQPSVALIKSHLTQPAGLRDIIETLKTWQFDPHAKVAEKLQATVNAATETEPTAALIATAIAAVREEFAPLHQEVAELKAEVTALKKALLTQ
ncbi:hypothetical protein [Moritella sp. F3]|uniref:hypothetical protein n=1 Tax=Moritella sp. F3 TaxID=2718882 RepID=UPI0018E17E5A|nr:hypothetical protein [Moritella sp. F3]GIC78577.1 hypothetical protein FMO001_33040 [Moritella sp. F1]GIC83772.1 hypothetical protein FMO003_40520 [Moritella sp. F3]